MEPNQIIEQVGRMRSTDHRFIKWWQREHDYLHFELLDRFEERLRTEEEGIKWLEGLELLDIEEMWEEVQRRFPDRVRREKRTLSGEVVIWNRPGKGEQTCPFTAESLMTIFDVETRGRVVG